MRKEDGGGTIMAIRALIVEYQNISRGQLQHTISLSDIASSVDIAANTAVVARNFAAKNYAIIILGHGTGRLDMIKPQVTALKTYFPKARVWLYGPHDLGFAEYSADGFISNRDPGTTLVDTIRRAIGS
jgi:hypothetical protein